MKIRGLFEKMFGNNTSIKQSEISNTPNEWNFYGLLNSFNNMVSMNTGRKWDMNVVRRAVDAYARNFAKLKGNHICVGTRDASLERLLQFQPNPLMEAYSFYYKIAANLKLTNNAFIYPEYEKAKLVALWPIQSNQIQLLWKDKELYIKFIFATGKLKVLPYESLIHLRGHYYEHDILGSDSTPLNATLSLTDAVNKGVEESSKLINRILGILHAKTATKDDDLVKTRNKFVRDNLSINGNGSGVIVTDAKLDYTPINSETPTISKDHLTYTKEEIYDYFGVNEKIVKNQYSDEEWNAFYEGGIEPVAVQMSQCFTNVLFTKHEKEFGNQIMFSSNRLQYMSVQTKTNFVKEIAPLGVLKKNVILEIFNLPLLPTEEGEKIIQSLNWIDASKADEYQIGKREVVKNGEQKQSEQSKQSDQPEQSEQSG